MSILCQTLLFFYEYTTHTHIKSTMFKDNSFFVSRKNKCYIINSCFQCILKASIFSQILGLYCELGADRGDKAGASCRDVSSSGKGMCTYINQICTYVCGIGMYLYCEQGAVGGDKQGASCRDVSSLSHRNLHMSWN